MLFTYLLSCQVQGRQSSVQPGVADDVETALDSGQGTRCEVSRGVIDAEVQVALLLGFVCVAGAQGRRP